MQTKTLTAVAAAALMISPALPGVAVAQSGNPLNSIFSCQSPGAKQGSGAAVGAVLGGLVGNTTANKNTRTTSTVLGAALGAAAGSYVGCRMQTSDQQRAEVAAQQALSSGQNASWTNPQTGAYGRVDVVASDRYDQSRYYDRSRDEQYGDDRANYARPVSLRGVRFASGVQASQAYFGAAPRYQAADRLSLKSSASRRAQTIGRLAPGESFDVLARVNGDRGTWLLVGRDRTAIGYVMEDLATPMSRTYADRDQDRRGASNQMCRTFDQTISTGRGGAAETHRYTACQTANGEWVVQS